MSNQSHPNNQQQNSSPLQHQGSSPSDLGEQTPYPGTSNDKTEAARVLNLFGDNVVTDNLDYINNLLKSQFPDNVGPKNQQRKKRQNRQESKEPSSAQTTEDVTSPTQMSNALSPPVNSPNIFPEKGQNSDPNSSFMSPIEPVNNGKIEIQIASGILESADLVIKGREARKMSEIVGKQEIETVGDFYKGEIPDVGKRSMSMEDVKVVTRDFAKRNEKTKNVNILTGRKLSIRLENNLIKDVDTRVERSYGQGQLDRSSKSINQDGNINNSDAKTEFSATLGHFIDYFQRSDTQQYRTIKASQYFHNGSHKGNSQRSGPSLNMENDALKHQVLKLRAKVEELMLMNELLTKERKLLKQKEEDLQYVILT